MQPFGGFVGNVHRSPHRNIRITKLGEKLLREYAKKHGMWWITGAYVPPVPSKVNPAGIAWYYNPACKHPRCAYDICNCAECKAYSIAKGDEHARELAADTGRGTRRRAGRG